MSVHSPTRPLPADLRKVLCWTCQQNVREMVFLPNFQGSYLSINCKECTKAPPVLERVYQQQEKRA